jgi:hypothetical protein
MKSGPRRLLWKLGRMITKDGYRKDLKKVTFSTVEVLSTSQTVSVREFLKG